MSILSRQLHRTIELLHSYDHQKPFPGYLSGYFRLHPEMGSKDRKTVRDLAFSYLRLGNALKDSDPEIRVAAGLFLSSSASSATTDFILGEYMPSLRSKVEGDFSEKVSALKLSLPEFKTSDVFPFLDQLSPQIDQEQWIRSLFSAPLVYVRVRKRFEKKVLDEFERNQIHFEPTNVSGCYSVTGLNNAESLEGYKKGYFELQDKMSQRTVEYMKPGKNELWWDACAASGGKSLLLMEQSDKLFVEATDLRPTILANYAKRMDRAGWKGNYSTTVADLSGQFNPSKMYDGILADVPCSGSGTWSRNPEGMTRYKVKDLEDFSRIQRTIVDNLLPSLKKGCPLIYITCSVFRAENEDNIKYLEKESGLAVEEMSYLNGYREKADTLFICRMKSP